MKVLDTNLTATSAAGQSSAAAPARPPGQSATPEGSAANGDRVELSGFSGKLSSALGAETQDRAARVAALASQYQAGRYQPDAQETSRALVHETLDAAPGEKGA